MHEALLRLHRQVRGERPAAILAIAGDGSQRTYHRLIASDGSTRIGVFGPDADENRAFLSYTRAFRGSRPEGLVALVEDPGPARSAGYGINEQGDVVGNSGTESTPDATAWLWTEGGGRVNLLDLIDVPGIYGIASGEDINDHGQIVARAITDDPYGAAALLTPPGP